MYLCVEERYCDRVPEVGMIELESLLGLLLDVTLQVLGPTQVVGALQHHAVQIYVSSSVYITSKSMCLTQLFLPVLRYDMPESADYCVQREQMMSPNVSKNKAQMSLR